MLQVQGLSVEVGGKVVVEFADSGPGIPDAVKDRIFTPFFTTKTTGSGLGLTISSRLVALMGGVLRVESEEGRGATFRFELQARVAMGLESAKQTATAAVARRVPRASRP